MVIESDDYESIEERELTFERRERRLHDETMNQLFALEAAVKQVLAQKDDDHCWRDAYTEMARLVGVDWQPEVLDKTTHLENCSHFHDCLTTGTHYITPTVPRAEYDRLLAESLRFYHADGTFEVLSSAEDVVRRRVESAGEIVRLKADLLEVERQRDALIAQRIRHDGQFAGGRPWVSAGNVFDRKLDEWHETKDLAIYAVHKTVLATERVNRDER